jgi:DNA-binding LytR/AlgR family response regulator
MTALIIEDERPASERLQRALKEVCPGVEIAGMLSSVTESVKYFRNNGSPDLVFMDIELADGQSFEIFEKAKVMSPVIFVTAYDEYWQKAFEQNSIDYLLKPIRKERLLTSVLKYQHLKRFYNHGVENLLLERMRHPNILVKRGAEFIAVKQNEVAYFYAADKLVFMVCRDGRKYLMHQTLSELNGETDANNFYRVNRKFLVHVDAINKIKALPKSKLLLDLQPSPSQKVIVSQENSSGFKQWMQGR